MKRLTTKVLALFCFLACITTPIKIYALSNDDVNISIIPNAQIISVGQRLANGENNNEFIQKSIYWDSIKSGNLNNFDADFVYIIKNNKGEKQVVIDSKLFGNLNSKFNTLTLNNIDSTIESSDNESNKYYSITNIKDNKATVYVHKDGHKICVITYTIVNN